MLEKGGDSGWEHSQWENPVIKPSPVHAFISRRIYMCRDARKGDQISTWELEARLSLQSV